MSSSPFHSFLPLRTLQSSPSPLLSLFALPFLSNFFWLCTSFKMAYLSRLTSGCLAGAVSDSRVKLFHYDSLLAKFDLSILPDFDLDKDPVDVQARFLSAKILMHIL